MSMTAVLRDTSARRFLNHHITKPSVPARVPAVIQPSGFHAGTLGTAFELLLCQGLFQRYPCKGHYKAVPRGIAFLEADWSCFPPDVSEAVLAHIEPALAVHGSIRKDTPLTDEQVRATIMLAYAVSFFRAPTWWAFSYHKAVEIIERPIPRATLDELKAMVELVPWQAFEPQRRIHFNPEFGVATRKLYGADADLAVDGTLVDVKTQQHCYVGIKAIRQVVCYAALANRYGMDGKAPFRSISRVGVYLARAGRLETFDLRECLAREDEKAVTEMLVGFYGEG